MADPTAVPLPAAMARPTPELSAVPPPIPEPYSAQVRAALLDRLACTDANGSLRELVSNYPKRGGKGVRSTFCIASCAALGGAEKDAVPFAVAIELLHNAFLVHDDISDGSPLRRGRPTLPVEHGVGLALCAGNALAVEALAAMQDAARAAGVDPSTGLDEVVRTIRQTLDGQAQELRWERDRRLDVTVADYLEMAVRKTAWYSVVLPFRLGALVACGELTGDRFLRSGALIGVVLQIADDLQSLLSPAGVTGKELGDDLVEGKRSLPVIHCLETGTELDRRRMARMLTVNRASRDPAAVQEIRELLEHTDSIAYARDSAIALAEAARVALAADIERLVSAAHVALIEAVLDGFVARCG